MNALWKVAGALVAVAGFAAPAFAQTELTVPGGSTTGTYMDYTITLDDVEGLGQFVEIERVVEDGDAEALQTAMFGFAKDVLGLERDDAVMRGYDILMHYELGSRRD